MENIFLLAFLLQDGSEGVYEMDYKLSVPKPNRRSKGWPIAQAGKGNKPVQDQGGPKWESGGESDEKERQYFISFSLEAIMFGTTAA